MIYANNPELESWVEIPTGSDFPIQNLPFGIFQPRGLDARVGVAIGNYVIDLVALHDLSLLEGLNIPRVTLQQRYLNPLMALGRERTRELRDRLAQILEKEGPYRAEKLAEYFLHPMENVRMLLPVQVGDYTDFYSSKEHATNVGSMFRDPDNALLPNWLHLPVGYHGRSSSIIVSDTPVYRPMGQTRPDPEQPPVFGPCKLLDFEVEMAFVVGKSTQLGQRVSTEDAEDYIFGLVLFNDWSARDIQKWEYVPLGPFLGKSFASTISPWIITLDALEPFRVQGPEQDPPVLPYLRTEGPHSFDIALEAHIETGNGASKKVCQTNFKYMYWSMAQQLAHHTVNGCNLNVGDMMASGTISGPEPDSFGSMLEISWRGTKPVSMPDGTERKFIQDGDSVVLKGYCEKEGVRIGFGNARGKVFPAP